MSNLEDSMLVASQNKLQMAIILVGIIQKNRTIHCLLFRHHVVIDPSAIVLMTLLNINLECHFTINFELVQHVEILTKHLLNRPSILGWHPNLATGPL